MWNGFDITNAYFTLNKQTKTNLAVIIQHYLTSNCLKNITLEVYSLSLHLERSDYSLERSDCLVERSDQRMERRGLERSDLP